MKLFKKYLKQNLKGILLFLIFTFIFGIVFFLYKITLKAVFYPAILCAVVGIAFLIFDYLSVLKKHKKLSEIDKLTSSMLDSMPQGNSIEETDYRNLIKKLTTEISELEYKKGLKYRDMIDYYTVWAHQIKTPIAAIRLARQNEDTPLSRRLTGEVGRVEQYVQMALTYLRLGSDSSDYVIRSCALDDIVRPAVRRFAGEFIQRKIQLNYQMLNYTVITDEKWLGFVVEQVLSNALKYTPQGSVSIYMEPEGVLCIRDTGIGIAPEDLPRVFEKGYTGYNGRSHRKASGLGLYLCREILTRLGHSVSAESQVDHGTTIRIDLRQHKTIQE